MISIERKRIIIKVVLWTDVGALLALTAGRFLLTGGTRAGFEETSLFWLKVAALLGLGSVVVLAFLSFREKRRQTSETGTPSAEPVPLSNTTNYDPHTIRPLSPDSTAAPRRYSFAAMAAAAVVVAVFSQDALFGNASKQTPVSATRTVEAFAVNRAGTVDYDLGSHQSGEPIPSGSSPVQIMIIDGNRNGQLVPFPHDDHLDYLGEENACGTCHHQNMPFDQHSSCVECHRDMFATTDTFSHGSHVEKLGGNEACIACHENPEGTKTRDTATPCAACHTDMVVEGSFVEAPEGGLKGHAASYRGAMHGLCVGCHFESGEADCAFCHRDSFSTQLRKQGPYAASRP
jgi:hypothetical protein